MAANERIENLISKEALESFDQLNDKVAQGVAGIEKLIAAGVKLNSGLGGGGFKKFSDDTKALSENEKALEQQAKQLEVAQAKLNATFTANAEKLAQAKVVSSEVNKQMRDQARDALGLTDAYDKLTRQYNDAAKEAKNLSIQFGANSKEAQEASKRALELDKRLKDADASVGRFNKNVGNYNESTKIIAEALQHAQEKFNGLTKSADASPAAIKAAGRELDALRRITGDPQFMNVSFKFGDTKAEINQLTHQLQSLKADGLDNNSDSVNLLKGRLAELTKEVRETRSEIKAIGSDTRAFDLFASSVKSLVSIYEVAAGASALFGKQNEEVEQTIKKLVAVQALANGVQEIANELTEKGTAANKVYSFFQNQVTVALDGSATAGARLRAVLLTLGVGALIVGLGLLIANFDKLKRALSGLNEEQQLSQEIQEKAIDGYIKEKVELEELVKEAKDENTTKERRNQILRDLHERSGTYFSDLKTEKDLIDKGTDAVAKYIQALELKAQAQAATELLAEKEKGIVQRQIQLQTELNKFQSDFEKKKFKVSDDASVNAKQEAILKRTIQTYKDILSGKQKDSILEALKEDAEPVINVIDQINAKLKNLGGDPGATTQSAFAKVLKFDDADLKRISDAFKKVSESEDLFLVSRIKAREKSFEIEKEILRKQMDVEIENINAQIELEKTSKTVDLSKIQQLNDQKIEAQKTFNKQSARLSQDLQSDLFPIRQSFIAKERELQVQANEQFLEDQKKREQASIDSIQNEHEKRLLFLQQGQESEIKALNTRYQQGIATTKEGSKARLKVEEDFANQRADIEYKYALATLQTEIELAKRIIALRKSLGQNTTAAEKELSNAEIALSDLVTKHKLENDKRQAKSGREKLAEIQKGIETVQTIQQKVDGVLSGFISANTDRQKNALQDQIDAIEKKKATEIEAINASALSEEEKANRIKVLEATADARKQQLEQKQRQLDIQRAKFEKTKNIGEIIVNTALAVVKALPNIPLAIAVGALGAAELAVAVATPLPKFEHGTDDAPGGLSLVGEKRRELIVTPTGELIETPGIPTVMNIPKHSIVLPDARKMLESGLSGLAVNAKGLLIKYDKKDNGEVVREIQKLASVVKNKREINLSTSEKGLSAMWRYGANKIGYVDDNLGF